MVDRHSRTRCQERNRAGKEERGHWAGECKRSMLKIGCLLPDGALPIVSVSVNDVHPSLALMHGPRSGCSSPVVG